MKKKQQDIELGAQVYIKYICITLLFSLLSKLLALLFLSVYLLSTIQTNYLQSRELDLSLSQATRIVSHLIGSLTSLPVTTCATLFVFVLGPGLFVCYCLIFRFLLFLLLLLIILHDSMHRIIPTRCMVASSFIIIIITENFNQLENSNN